MSTCGQSAVVLLEAWHSRTSGRQSAKERASASMSGAILFFIVVIGWVVLLFMMFSSGVSFIRITTYESRSVPEEKKREVIPVDVAVYYETLCPYSREFITSKLLPAYLRAPELMNLSLVPYGNAETKVTAEGYEFSCQHGLTECQGNKIHSCAVELLDDPTSQLQYVACTMRGEDDPVESGSECARSMYIVWEPIMDCAEGPLGNELLYANGVRTRSVRPELKGVPTITLNGIRKKSTVVWNDLLGEVCKLFEDPKPEECLRRPIHDVTNATSGVY
ncbi:gamma-interferon-inducible lysosomal thiol reductase-like [Schistocerca piceifrons]|uniref:gamma-interferon-inducible lysosomal thiol reductase-like n=1 Tax=Schistocerca piceifrons TaxID=274613 RepID=UPI001F5EED7F|nr:gamma-interferon-inducible lysosomal thiol reductase-like [Schistocerca piceifrons]